MLKSAPGLLIAIGMLLKFLTYPSVAMGYIFTVAILAICVILILRRSTKVNAKKRLEDIRVKWGKLKKGEFYFERIGKFATLTSGNGSHQLSTQSMVDIDIEELFTFVDRTNSRIGQQYLFKRLIQPATNKEALKHTNERADFFTSNVALREEIQCELDRLNTPDAYYLTSLLQDKLLERPWWVNFVFLNVVVVVALLLFSITHPVLLIVLIIPITANMLLHYWNKNNTYLFGRSFPQLSLLIDAADKLSKKHIDLHDKSVEDSVATLRPFQWKMRLLSMANDGTVKDDLNLVATYLVELLKVFFLVEIYTIFNLTRELETKKDSILTLFNYVGDIDTTISVASLRAGGSKTCRPDFTESKKELSLKNVYHPLINNCATNDLNINGNSILITGSNMSGKSTFLRTVFINSILAQSIYTCFADEFKSPPLKQFSSIRIDDNLAEGTSYYMAEVNVMFTLIKEVEANGQNLFILDEVFKGTNTVERIASAKAILSYLNKNNNIVIVSTHDIELSEMLSQEYDLYHFTDMLENGELHFDHKIKEGKLKTRNAIKILELAHYPAEIIQEARSLSSNLTT